MASRTCPHCNHQYSIKDHFLRISTFRAVRSWNCSNCNALIRINTKWGMILSVFFCTGLFVFDYFNNQCGLTPTFLITFIVYCIIINYIVHIFDKYELAK